MFMVRLPLAALGGQQMPTLWEGLMAATKPGNPGFFRPGDPRTNKGKALVEKRGPITTALSPVRTLFEFMDDNGVPYSQMPNRESMERYRTGKRGLSVYTLIEWADRLGFDIVAVPRQPAPQQASTLATPAAAVATRSGVGMDPAACAGVGIAA